MADRASGLAADRLGVPGVTFFVMSGIAPLTVAAGVVTTAYAVTGLTAIPAAFLGTALMLALFSVGLAAAILVTMIWLALRNYATLLGVPPGAPAARWLPAIYLAAALAGAGWALASRRPASTPAVEAPR